MTDMNEWPRDANELMARLKGWWSLNQWLLDDADDKVAAGQYVNQTPAQVIDYLKTRAEGYKVEAATWRGRALRRLYPIGATAEAIEDVAIEALADYAHRAWSGWTQHLFQNLDAAHIIAWHRQMATPYADLSEGEKESDRKEAREILRVLRSLVESASIEPVEKAKKAKM